MMKTSSELAGIKIGGGHPVRIMGVINVSPESFYKGSVQNRKTIQKAAAALAEQKADIIDIGAMSTAPYLANQISETEETERIVWAVNAVRAVTQIPISIDTSRPSPALAGIDEGADILNDVTALAGGAPMAAAARAARGLILMAHPAALSADSVSSPFLTVKKLLTDALKRAKMAKVNPARILIDPGIGFFRHGNLEWWKWDLAVLRELKKLRTLGAPLLVGVSRKSFIGEVLGGRVPEDRLAGSLGATVAAVLSGAAVIRTHDVRETRDAIRVAEAIDHERELFRSEIDRKERRASRR